MPDSESLSLLGRSLRAAVDGPYFPDWEFETLMGLTRDEMRVFADAWPQTPPETPNGYDSAAHAQMVAINNAANNLLGYPHGADRFDLEADLEGTIVELAKALASWRREAQLDPRSNGSSTD